MRVRKVWWMMMVWLVAVGAENLMPKAYYCLDGNHADTPPAACRWIPFVSEHYNDGFSKVTLWVRFRLQNNADRAKTVAIEVDNPLVETLRLFDEQGGVYREGMIDGAATREFLHPVFFVSLPPRSKTLWHLRVHNRTTALQFGLHTKDPEAFRRDDRGAMTAALVLTGMVGAFLLLSLTLWVFVRDRVHLFYALYLAALLFQQLTYIGLLPVWMPSWFTRIDNELVVPKLALLIVTATLYARAFFQTSRLWPDLDRGYRWFLWGALLVATVTGWPFMYEPRTIILLGALFVLFNLYAAVTTYRRGFVAARFFLAAWIILAVGYMAMILDALGFVSVMYRVPSLILGSTVLEAVLLMLAMVDRYRIDQGEKLELERRMGEVLRRRNAEIETTVAERTAALRRALEEKLVLMQELHHRVKNNLQLVVSLIRLQKSRIPAEVKERFTELENRIGAVARSHEMLSFDPGTERVDMARYLEGIAGAVVGTGRYGEVEFFCDTSLALPQKEAVQVGLVANELLTNVLKHIDVNRKRTKVRIAMKRRDETVVFEMEREGGETLSRGVRGGLGCAIVDTIVEEQLGGKITRSKDRRRVTIRFKLREGDA